MQKQFSRLFVAIMCVMILLTSFNITAIAETITKDNCIEDTTQIVSIIENQDDTAAVGNQNRYKSSSGSSSSSRSSSSSSRSSSSRSSGSYSSSSSGGGGGFIFFVIIAIVVYFLLRKKAKQEGKSVSEVVDEIKRGANKAMSEIEKAAQTGTTGTAKRAGLAQLQADDPNFNADKFEAWANEVFMNLQRAWSNKDWKIIRPFESEELFREHSQQLQEYVDNGTTNIIGRVGIKQTEIIDYSRDDKCEYLTVQIYATHLDYIKEDATGKIITGDQNTLWDMLYEMKFMRTIGTKTPDGGIGEMNITNCPNCGAPTEVTSAGECEYCHSVITTGAYNWVLVEYTGDNL